MSHHPLKSDKSLDELRGEIKNFELRTFFVNNGVKSFRTKIIGNYNKSGFKTSQREFNENGAIFLRQESRFKGEMKEGFQNYDENNNEVGHELYVFNSNNEIIHLYRNGKKINEYEYENGKISAIRNLPTGVEEFYRYDKEFVIEKFQTPSRISNPVNELLGIKNNPLATSYTNDRYGNILKMIIYDLEEKTIQIIIQNKYNEQGDKIEMKSYKGDGTILSHYNYEYKYDARKNWLSKIEFEKNEIVQISERNLEYF